MLILHNELIGYLVLLISVSFNIFLAVIIMSKANRKPEGCSVTNNDFLSRQIELEKTLNIAYPGEQGKLSHLLVPMAALSSNLEMGIPKMFAQWIERPPCLRDSTPTNWTNAHVTLTFYLESRTTDDLFTEKLQRLYNDLPKAIRACFGRMEIRHAGLTKDNSVTTGIALANQRAMFKMFVTNQISLQNPSYVMWMGGVEENVIPIQSDWLNLLDYECRPPIEKFWIKGSLFRGPKLDPAILETGRTDRLHLNRNALYNIGDLGFGEFYLERILPFILKKKGIAGISLEKMPFESDIPRYLFDLANYEISREYMSLFRPSNFIQNYGGQKFKIDEILDKEPETFMIVGKEDKRAI